MPPVNRSFQVFAKPAGARCNLACAYCYYLARGDLAPGGEAPRMPDAVLEAYIIQHIRACADPVIAFSWHGGEPTVLGLDYFRTVVDLQRRHCPPGRRIANGMQTNGTLLDEDWGRFLSEEGFSVGLSMDGPARVHDHHRVTRGGGPTHERVMAGYRLLQGHRVHPEILCVVSAANAAHPLEVYGFFRQIGARHITFLPLVEPQPDAPGGVTPETVPAEAWGEFLCAVFDEWKGRDIGRIEVQIFDETVRTAFGQEHSLCVLRPTCGDVPVVELNGDFYSCDHFVDVEHRLGNILDTSLAELLESPAQRAFGRAKLDDLPGFCIECEVRSMCNGGCPKNRFTWTPKGEAGLNYLCPGYRRFFTHCRPFVDQVAALARRQAAVSGHQEDGGAAPARAADPRRESRPGRNDPCPCGSGRKYKHCCMGR